MMARCFVFGALPVSVLTEKPSGDDLVIAADKGYEVARSFGIEPDIVVGDFDSLGHVPDAANLICLEVRKDDTDLEHAVNVALEKGCRDFVIYGGVGGKLDHTMGNIAIAERVAIKGGRAVFYGEDSSFTVIRNASFRLPRHGRGRVSVISLGGMSCGVSIRGLSYEVGYFDLPRATTRGVSNAFIGRQAEVTVREGTLLIIWDTYE